MTLPLTEHTFLDSLPDLEVTNVDPLDEDVTPGSLKAISAEGF